MPPMPPYAVRLLAAGLAVWLVWAGLNVSQGVEGQGVWFFALLELLFWAGVLLLGASLLGFVLARHEAWRRDLVAPRDLRPEAEERSGSWGGTSEA